MNSTESEDPIVALLATTHSAISARHAQARANLLESLADTSISIDCQAKPIRAWRYIVGGLGLSAVASSIAVALWFFGAMSPAVAMERLAKALDQVNTYSYRMEKVYVSQKGEGRTVRQVTLGRWRTAPIGMHATMRIVEILGTNTSAPKAPKTLVDLEETHQVGERGILINHLKREYWRMNEEINASSIPPSSPQVAVYMVQQRRGRVLRDLGKKQVGGQLARGLEIILEDAQPISELGPTITELEEGQADWDWRNVRFEVWIDPESDLPVEFRCARRGEDFTTTYRFSDLKWNVQFAAEAFDPVVPDGYTERDNSQHSEDE